MKRLKILLRLERWRLSLDKVGIKPGDKILNKGIIRIQKLIDELTREMNDLKARVTKLES